MHARCWTILKQRARRKKISWKFPGSHFLAKPIALRCAPAHIAHIHHTASSWRCAFRLLGRVALEKRQNNEGRIFGWLVRNFSGLCVHDAHYKARMSSGLTATSAPFLSLANTFAIDPTSLRRFLFRLCSLRKQKRKNLKFLTSASLTSFHWAWAWTFELVSDWTAPIKKKEGKWGHFNPFILDKRRR